jgi:hypothetical protein
MKNRNRHKARLDTGVPGLPIYAIKGFAEPRGLYVLIETDKWVVYRKGTGECAGHYYPRTRTYSKGSRNGFHKTNDWRSALTEIAS